MKSKEELNALKKRYENLTEEIRELTEEELKEVTGGVGLYILDTGSLDGSLSRPQTNCG